MSELKNLIHSEVADFFAAFGSPGEPDVESGEAQKKLTALIDSLVDADIARRGAAAGEPVVTIPARFKPKVSSLLGKEYPVMECRPDGGWVNLSAVKAALDNAGVKWEVTGEESD